MNDNAIQDSRGPGTNKRFWTPTKDEKLVEALLELKNEGSLNAERGFKPGHFSEVEKRLAISLPNSGLKADPHIKSRMKIMNKHFNTVFDMVNGGSTSGFGWDNVKQYVTAENVVWDEYLKSHKAAAQFRDKSFPYYHELCIIFGKDRATGKDAETPADVVEGMDREEPIIDDNDVGVDVEIGLDGINASMAYAQPQTPTTGNTNEVTSSRQKKKRKRSDTGENLICDVIEKSSTNLGLQISNSSERLSRAIEYASINDMKMKINEELSKLAGISMIERHKATVRIRCDRDLTMQFFYHWR